MWFSFTCKNSIFECMNLEHKVFWIYDHNIIIVHNIIWKKFSEEHVLTRIFQELWEFYYRDHPLSTYALTGMEGVKEKACISCFYDIIILFKRVQGETGCLKITKFERTFFMDISILYFTRIHVTFVHVVFQQLFRVYLCINCPLAGVA